MDPFFIKSQIVTEEELQTSVNAIANNIEYYKDSIEMSSSKFQGESGLYTPFPPPEPIEPNPPLP